MSASKKSEQKAPERAEEQGSGGNNTSVVRAKRAKMMKSRSIQFSETVMTQLEESKANDVMMHPPSMRHRGLPDPEDGLVQHGSSNGRDANIFFALQPYQLEVASGRPDTQ